MKYMIHSSGYEAIKDIENISTLEKAKERLQKLKDKVYNTYDVDEDCDTWDEDEEFFSLGRTEMGYKSFRIYEVPDFKNKAEEYIWKAKLALDDADDASIDYTYSLMDNCVDYYTSMARKYIDEAINLMKG